MKFKKDEADQKTPPWPFPVEPLKPSTERHAPASSPTGSVDTDDLFGHLTAGMAEPHAAMVRDVFYDDLTPTESGALRLGVNPRRARYAFDRICERLAVRYRATGLLAP